MPNQLNYSTPLTTNFQRPSRISSTDVELLGTEQVQILFGTNERDVVELWFYNPDGSFASHLNLPFNDPALTVATLITQNGSTEILNLDLKQISTKMQIQPGRYAIVANFFRDEVGSEIGNKFYINDISADRTELKLTSIDKGAIALNSIYSFVTPSVPKIYAKGLLDQIFDKLGDASKSINVDTLKPYINETENITKRIDDANLSTNYTNMIKMILSRTYTLALDNMANAKQNNEVQYKELEAYVTVALDFVIRAAIQSGEIDTRFQLK